MGQKIEFPPLKRKKKEQRFLPKVLLEILTLEFYEKKSLFSSDHYCLNVQCASPGTCPACGRYFRASSHDASHDAAKAT
jgi:hypothetical protein